MLDRCRLCGGADLTFAYAQGNDRQFRFYRCATCALVNYDLELGLNQSKYSNASAVPASDDDADLNRGSTDSAVFLSRHVSPPGRLLDIGCGNGRLIYLMARQGWEVSGLELTPELAERAASDTGAEIQVANFLEYERADWEGRFDVVVLRHVLEHLPDTPLALGRISAWLRPGGVALFEFPNIDAWELKWKRGLERAKVKRKRYRDDYVPGHCNEFCRRSFTFAAEQVRFQLQRWETYSHHPLKNALFARVPIGNKARALARKREC